MNIHNVTKLIVYPSLPIGVNGETIDPGESAEITGEREIAMLQSALLPNKFSKVEIYCGDAKPQLWVSTGTGWLHGKEAEAADAEGGAHKRKKK